MEGIKKYYEEYHKVKISSDVIKQTVIMSEKYIHDRFLPDKAIDILDEACSRKNLENKDLFKLEILKQELKRCSSSKRRSCSSRLYRRLSKSSRFKNKRMSINRKNR